MDYLFLGMLIPFWVWYLCKGSYTLPSGLSKPRFDLRAELFKHLLSDWNASGLVSVWSLIVLESSKKLFFSGLFLLLFLVLGVFRSEENECLLESSNSNNSIPLGVCRQQIPSSRGRIGSSRAKLPLLPLFMVFCVLTDSPPQSSDRKCWGQVCA